MKITSKKKHSFIAVVILYVIALAFLLPLLWLVLSSFNPAASQSFAIPQTLSFENYRIILENVKNRQSLWNSSIISLVQTVVVIICSIMAAYPLSRYQLKKGQHITMGLLFLTSIPITAILVPVYQLFIAFRLVDSVLGTIIFLSASGLPYGIWMMKNFLDGVSVELEESAWIDGANTGQSLVHVVLPLMLPGLFTVAMFSFIGSWGNFFVPFILLISTDKIPASVNIYRFFGEHGIVMYGQLAAYSIVYMLPVFVLYSFSQKYMSQGFSMQGAAKG